MRRRFAIALGLALLGLASITSVHATVVVLAPHPDDAEASCGGLIANTTAAGESIIVLAMTSGEIGVWQKNQAEARAIRQQEQRNAAAVLGARAEFFGGIDGSLAVDTATTARLVTMLLRWKPRLVLAPWPLDVHADHQASGLLAWRAFQDRRLDFELYFYETSNSPHTLSLHFEPTDWVDVSDAMDVKRRALYEQKSQNPAEWWDMYVNMARFRGYEADVPFAEAYLHARNSSGMGGRPGVAGRTLIGRR